MDLEESFFITKTYFTPKIILPIKQDKKASAISIKSISKVHYRYKGLHRVDNWYGADMEWIGRKYLKIKWSGVDLDYRLLLGEELEQTFCNVKTSRENPLLTWSGPFRSKVPSSVRRFADGLRDPSVGQVGPSFDLEGPDQVNRGFSQADCGVYHAKPTYLNSSQANRGPSTDHRSLPRLLGQKEKVSIHHLVTGPEMTWDQNFHTKGKANAR